MTRFMKTVKSYLSLFLLAWLAMPLSASALSSDRNQAIDISADKLDIDDSNHISIYQGNVVMVQGSLHIKADKITLRFNAHNELQRLEIEGRPATLQQTTDQQQQVRGSARKIIYSDHLLTLKLNGDAHFVTDQNSIDGEWITVNTDTDAINAGSTAGKNRVRMLIQPNAGAASNSDKTPQ